MLKVSLHCKVCAGKVKKHLTKMEGEHQHLLKFGDKIMHLESWEDQLLTNNLSLEDMLQQCSNLNWYSHWINDLSCCMQLKHTHIKEVYSMQHFYCFTQLVSFVTWYILPPSHNKPSNVLLGGINIFFRTWVEADCTCLLRIWKWDILFANMKIALCLIQYWWLSSFPYKLVNDGDFVLAYKLVKYIFSRLSIH